MYVGVPITDPVRVLLVDPGSFASFAMPKSSSFTRSPLGTSGSGTK
jgi:hypothetical protein